MEYCNVMNFDIVKMTLTSTGSEQQQCTVILGALVAGLGEVCVGGSRGRSAQPRPPGRRRAGGRALRHRRLLRQLFGPPQLAQREGQLELVLRLRGYCESLLFEALRIRIGILIRHFVF